MREGSTAKYLRGHTSMCSQQEGRCELGFQKRMVNYNLILRKEDCGRTESHANRPLGRQNLGDLAVQSFETNFRIANHQGRFIYC